MTLVFIDGGYVFQRRSQDLGLGGGHPADCHPLLFFRHLRLPTGFSGGGVVATFSGTLMRGPDSVGGGVVAEIFRDPRQRTTFNSVWGGGSSRKFSGSPSAHHIQWGWGV